MMLMKRPAAAVRGVLNRMRATYRHGPSRLRLRWRLYAVSAPLIVVLLAVAAKMISVVLVGNSAIADFDRHDIESLRGDVAMLEFVNVIDPAKTSFANADLLVLEGRLDDAEAKFRESLTRTDHGASCPARVNLELVQETLGDIATRSGRKDDAERWYRSAIGVVNDAPPACFADNDDPNEDRRAIRHEALPRLEQKLANLRRPPEPPPPPPNPIDPPPPPTSLTQMTSAPPLPHLGPAPDGAGAGDGAERAPQSGEGADQAPQPREGSDQAPQPGEGSDQAPQQGEGSDQAPQPGEGADEAPRPGDGSAEAPRPEDGEGPQPRAQPPLPGPNMPAPPTARGGEGPVVGPEGGDIDVLNPVSPDRLPSVGGGGPPGQELGIGDGDPLEQLRKLLDNANAHGDNRE